MGNVFNKRKINSKLGIIFQTSVFLAAAVGILTFAVIVCLSFTDFNLLNKPSYIWLENYKVIFGYSVSRTSVFNTPITVGMTALLLILTAVLPAVFVARLKLPFGIGIMGAFSVISLCATFPSCFEMFFSNDAYGVINSWLLSKDLIGEPIVFNEMMLLILVMWLCSLAPIFAITYTAARMKHSFLGCAIAVCSIPVFMCGFNGIVTRDLLSVSNFLSPSANWIYTMIFDTFNHRWEIGVGFALLVIGLIMLFCWCVVVCGIILALWGLYKAFRAIFKKFSLGSLMFKAVGYISFALSSLMCVIAFVYITMYLSRAFMPLNELFYFPSTALFPEQPTLQNFAQLFEMLSSAECSKHLFNSFVAVPLAVMPICFFVAIPSGIGLGAFNVFKLQKLLLLCYIPLLFIGSCSALIHTRMLDTYWVYTLNFFSTFEFFIVVFLAYLTVKLVSDGQRVRAGSVVVGTIFLMSSVYAMSALHGIWQYNSATFVNLRTWKYLGYTPLSVAAANDLLMLTATAAVLVIPLILLFILYLLHQRNVNQATK